MDMRPVLRVEMLVQTLKAEALAVGLPKSRLAEAARLHANTLRDLERDKWNPSLSTLRKLEVYLSTLTANATDPNAGQAGRQP